MYTIEKTEYGFKLTVSGHSNSNEIEQMKVDLLEQYSELDHPFSLVIDARHHHLINAEARKAIENLHAVTANLSLRRTAIVVDTVSQQGVARQVVDGTHTASIDRIIDASKTHDWEKVAVAWAADGVEPDREYVA